MLQLTAQELKTKSDKELHDVVEKERGRLRDLRFRLAGAQLKNIQQITEVKRNIARALTILNKRKSN